VKLSEKTTKVLGFLRLLRPSRGVFIRITDSTRAMLQLVEPYVAWGYEDFFRGE